MTEALPSLHHVVFCVQRENQDEAAEVEEFLEQQGEGVYSVVVRTADIAGPISIAATYGAEVEFQQHREGTGFALDEARLHPLHGMPVTFLATDRAD